MSSDFKVVQGQQANGKKYHSNKIGHFRCDYCGFEGSLTAENVRAHAHCSGSSEAVTPELTDEQRAEISKLLRPRTALAREVVQPLPAYDSKADTLEHMRKVAFTIHRVLTELLHRIEIHDIGKLAPEEKALFDEYTPKLKHTTYGSAEYKQFLKELQPALDHHYRTNRHHPEHFRNGISGMNLIDLLEMMCDWYASSTRHADGNPLRSIEINQERFKYSDELKEIFNNTMHWILGHPDPKPYSDVYWETKKEIWGRAAKVEFVDIDTERFMLRIDARDSLCMTTWNFILPRLTKEKVDFTVVDENGDKLTISAAGPLGTLRALIPMAAKARTLQLYSEFMTEAVEETAKAAERIGKVTQTNVHA